MWAHYSGKCARSGRRQQDAPGPRPGTPGPGSVKGLAGPQGAGDVLARRDLPAGVERAPDRPCTPLPGPPGAVLAVVLVRLQHGQ